MCIRPGRAELMEERWAVGELNFHLIRAGQNDCCLIVPIQFISLSFMSCWSLFISWFSRAETEGNWSTRAVLIMHGRCFCLSSRHSYKSAFDFKYTSVLSWKGRVGGGGFLARICLMIVTSHTQNESRRKQAINKQGIQHICLS